MADKGGVMEYKFFPVQDLREGDHILIDHDGTKLRQPIVVKSVDTTSHMHHVHINSLCYDRNLEVGLNAPDLAAK